MMAVVSDSTALIVLADQNRFDLLGNLFSEVYVPQAVWSEIHCKADFSAPSFIKCCIVQDDKNLQMLLSLLDQGESEAILLAKAKNLPLIIDERKGRKIATNMGVRIIGLLGILYLNIKKGHIPKGAAETFLDKARTDGFRISQKLIDEMFDNL